MSSEVFQPGRLRLARELNCWTQNELANRVGVSAAAVSQFEKGDTRPGPSTMRELASILDVPLPFLVRPLDETHDGFFRSHRRSSVGERRRARAIAHVAHDVATHPAVSGSLALLTLPALHPVPLEAERSAVEAVAQDVRREWKVPRGPVTSMVRLLEEHGIVVVRLPFTSAHVDAFSLPFHDRPVIVLGADKNDRARSRFDAAHELGHLVLHGERVWGLKAVEDQAHWFAAAFLMPEEDIASELPTRPDWPRLFDLKREWQVSLAALLMRARRLGRMSEAQYLTAVKTASARGWRRVEPVPLGAPERPRLVAHVSAPGLVNELHEELPAAALDELLGAA